VVLGSTVLSISLSCGGGHISNHRNLYPAQGLRPELLGGPSEESDSAEPHPHPHPAPQNEPTELSAPLDGTQMEKGDPVGAVHWENKPPLMGIHSIPCRPLK
jgi:hypothetical protein